MPGAPATSRNCARPIPTPSNTSSRSHSPNCCCSSRCSPTSSTTRRASRRSARTTASRAPTAPGRGVSISWQPRTEIVLKRHDAYKWGPSMYKNKGPVKFEKLVVKIVPEDSSRVAAMMSGQFDITHQFPAQFITQAKAAPMLTVTRGQAEFPAALFRLQDDAADGRRQARARGHEHRHQPRRDRQGHPARQCRSGLHHRRPGRARPRSGDQGHRQGRHRARQAAARRSRLEARRRRHPREGRREAGAEGLFHRQCQFGPRRRRDPGLSQEDRRRLAAATLGLDHRAGQDGRAGLRNLVGDGAVSVGRRPHEHLLQFSATSRRPTG